MLSVAILAGGRSERMGRDKALLVMLEGMLRNPSINLGPDGIQRLLAFSGILTESDVREFMDV
jgi:CTP:molybdopterin cytidylyltransferase MocA